MKKTSLLLFLSLALLAGGCKKSEKSVISDLKSTSWLLTPIDGYNVYLTFKKKGKFDLETNFNYTGTYEVNDGTLTLDIDGTPAPFIAYLENTWTIDSHSSSQIQLHAGTKEIVFVKSN